MKRITFIDGPLNGQRKYLLLTTNELSHVEMKAMLPPQFEHTTYRELVPGYWYVVKSEIKEMGI